MLWNFDGWSELDRLRREMDSLFSGYDRATGAGTFPLLNAYDDKDNVIITAELPGLTRDQVNITYSDGVLTLSGTTGSGDNYKDLTAVRQERAAGAFEKSVRIPTKIDQNGINAAFTNGILTVTLPKAEEAKPKTITVEAK